MASKLSSNSKEFSVPDMLRIYIWTEKHECFPKDGGIFAKLEEMDRFHGNLKNLSGKERPKSFFYVLKEWMHFAKLKEMDRGYRNLKNL